MLEASQLVSPSSNIKEKQKEGEYDYDNDHGAEATTTADGGSLDAGGVFTSIRRGSTRRVNELEDQFRKKGLLY